MTFDGKGIVVPPQDAETQAELSRIARRLGLEAAGIALDGLNDASCTAEMLNTSAGGSASDLKQGAHLAGFVREGYQVFNEASDLMVRYSAAVSDAQRSRSTDNATAEVAELAPFASRAAAAHMLVGGSHGLPALRGVGANGFFPGGRLSAQGAQALSLLRQSAISPALLEDTGELIEDIVFLPSAGGVCDSVRARIGMMSGRNDLLEATSVDQFYQRMGTSSEAFVEAREYLVAEFAAFDRARTYRLPAELLANGDMTSSVTRPTSLGGGTCEMALFAATRNPPTQPDPAWWSAVLRYDATPPSYETYLSGGLGVVPEWIWGAQSSVMGGGQQLPSGFTFGDETNFGSGVVTFTDPSPNQEPVGLSHAASLEVITERVRRADARLGALTVNSGVTAALGILRRTVSDIGHAPYTDEVSSSPTGRARLCTYIHPTYGTSDVEFLVELEAAGLPTSSGALLLLSGHAAFDCATTGMVEGTPCDSSLIESNDYATSWITEGGRVRAAAYTSRATWSVGGPSEDARSFFVVRRRDLATGTNVPGQYIPLASWVVKLLPQLSLEMACSSTVLSPGIDLRAANLIQPSTAFIGDQSFSCAGLGDDLRLPLENELTDDGNGIESSWRHYLQIAGDAATEADRLGEALIDQGLVMDQRAEMAVDTIERICGTRIDVSPTQSVPPSLTVMDSASCPVGYRGGGGTDPVPMSGTSTTCFLDPIQYAIANAADSVDRGALARCLGASDESLDNSFVGFGDTPLCFWQTDVSNPASICQGATNQHPCPVVAGPPRDEPDCSGEWMPDGATMLMVKQDRLLQLFHIPKEDETEQQLSPGEFPCGLLAQLRADPSSLSAKDRMRLLGSPFFEQESFTQTASSLRWIATAGDYSRVLAGNAVIASTGSPGLGSAEPRWPMGNELFTWSCPEDTAPMWGTAEGTSEALRTYSGPLGCIRNLGTPPAAPDGTGIAVGLSEGDERELRARVNDILARAVIAAHVITGTSLSESRIPYYPNRLGCVGGDEISINDFNFLPIGSGSVFESSVGDLRINHGGDGDEDGDDWPFADRHLLAQDVVDHSEWHLCPYNGTECTTFAFEQVGTVGDRVPVLMAELGEQDLVTNSARDVRRLWGRDGFVRALIGSALRSSVPQPHAMLSSFSTSSGPVQLEAISRYMNTTNSSARDCWHRDYGAFFDQNLAAPGQYTTPGRFARETLRAGDEPYRTSTSGSITRNDVLNALELTCMAGQAAQPSPIAYGCDTDVNITSVASLVGSASQIHCLANGLSNEIAHSVIRGLPASIVPALQSNSGTVYGGGSGEFGAQVAIIRTALGELQDDEAAIAASVHMYATSLDETRRTLDRHAIGAQIQDLQLGAQISSQINRCVVALAGVVSASGLSLDGKSVGAAITAGSTCIDSGVQVVVAAGIRALESDIGALDIESAFASADTQFAATSQAIQEHSANIRASLSRIDAATTQLRSLQGQGRTALSRALFLDASTTGAHLNVDTVMHRRYSSLRVRYDEAHTRAIRLAHIARLALEQRLGMNLSELSDNLATVPAPASWVDELCTMSPIDYSALRNSDSELMSPDNYQGYHIGDYVNRLEQVFESYSFAYPFQAGTDQVVLSVRDDLHGLRRACDDEAPNLLYQTQTLRNRSADGVHGWSDTGVVTSDADSSAPPGVDGAAVRVANAGGKMGQSVDLPIGRYRLSWYALDETSLSGGLDGGVALRAFNSSDDILDVLNAGGEPTRRLLPVVPPALGWSQYDYFFDVTESGPTLIYVRLDTGEFVTLAGIQLVGADPSFQGNINRPFEGTDETFAEHIRPRRFYPTGDDRMGPYGTCRDDGRELRRRAFTYRCARVCADGVDGTCSPEAAINRCFWETAVEIGSDELSRHASGTPAGFAAGNYNYRIESIGVNLVGTGLRDCERADTTGCYGAGNFSISIVHQGPYLVRNALGGLYNAPIFPGRIEGARALSAERYITNPISSADQALIQPYMRSELAGRPMSGTTFIRIWDEPTLAWENLQDVQLVVNYRYWTHQR